MIIPLPLEDSQTTIITLILLQVKIRMGNQYSVRQTCEILNEND